ncbi:UNVERIFIED_CONTAM: hypothetical protein PYX00_002249 [Menopon gallinae]|uniref:Uncharacterized protein n=1 Tax=Menopon gallinae TaxID=328185 RepID=A0AAW2IFX9_9NEOP
MIATVILSVVLFAASARTIEISEYLNKGKELADKYEELRNFSNAVYNGLKKHEEMNSERLEAFRAAVREMRTTFDEKIDSIKNKYLEPFDFHKDRDIYNCIMNLRGDTYKETEYLAHDECSEKGHIKNMDDLEYLKNSLTTIHGMAGGINGKSYESVFKCKDKLCIDNISIGTDTRLYELKKTFQFYLSLSSELAEVSGQALQDCLKILRNKWELSVRLFENKIKTC